MAEKLPTYGGQAVIEGVMMRGSSSVAIAMREDASDAGLARAQEVLIRTRPTAVNLRWALEEMTAYLAPLAVYQPSLPGSLFISFLRCRDM